MTCSFFLEATPRGVAINSSKAINDIHVKTSITGVEVGAIIVQLFILHKFEFFAPFEYRQNRNLSTFDPNCQKLKKI